MEKINNAGVNSALIYIPASLIIAGVFFVLTLIGNYTWVARMGGTVWVFALSMIIIMPLITSQVKKKYRSQE